MNRNSVATNVNHLAAMRRSMFPPAMLPFMNWYIVSTAVCTRFGRACMRLAMYNQAMIVSAAPRNR